MSFRLCWRTCFTCATRERLTILYPTRFYSPHPRPCQGFPDVERITITPNPASVCNVPGKAYLH